MNNLGFINTLKEKQASQKQIQAQREAEEVLTLSDLEGQAFIAFNGFPVFPIAAEISIQEALSQLTSLRNNYINAKMKLE